MIEEIITKIVKKLNELTQNKFKKIIGIPEILDELKNNKELRAEIEVLISNSNTQTQEQTLTSGVPFNEYLKERDLREKYQSELQVIKMEKTLDINRFVEKNISDEYLEITKEKNNPISYLKFLELLLKVLPFGSPESEILKKYNIKTSEPNSHGSQQICVEYKFNTKEIQIINEMIQKERNKD